MSRLVFTRSLLAIVMSSGLVVEPDNPETLGLRKFHCRMYLRFAVHAIKLVLPTTCTSSISQTVAVDLSLFGTVEKHNFVLNRPLFVVLLSESCSKIKSYLLV